MEESSLSKLLVERRGSVTVVTLNRAEVHNSVDAEMAVALAGVIEAFAGDAAASVLVITGAGDKAFCAGANLKGIDDLVRHRYAGKAGPMGFSRLDPGKPTIAAVNGYCFAGGMELACWCDFRIAAQNAEFGALNRRWGVPFTDGGTQRFPRIVGQGNALWLIQTGIRLDAHRALSIGLVQEVVPVGQALLRAIELAEHISQYPQASLRSDRAAALATFGLSLDEGLLLEAKLGRAAATEPEMWAGLRRFAAGDRPEPPAAVN